MTNDTTVYEAGEVGPMTPEEILGQLGIDETSINQLLVSTGVKIPSVLWPSAKILAADVLLASVLAADLVEGVDFSDVLGLLTISKEPEIPEMFPVLSKVLLDLCDDEAPAIGREVYERRIGFLQMHLLL